MKFQASISLIFNNLRTTSIQTHVGEYTFNNPMPKASQVYSPTVGIVLFDPAAPISLKKCALFTTTVH